MGNFICCRTARQFIGAVIVGALAGSSAFAAATTLDGFVTQVDSPTEFYVGSLRVSLNGKTQCETQELRSDIYLKVRGFFLLPRQYFLLQSRPVPKSEVTVPCDTRSLSVGSRLHVAGDRGQQENSFGASRLIIYKVDLQLGFSTSWKSPEWTGVALLEETPQVSRTAQGWTGTLWLDGYPMRIAPDTTLSVAPDVKELGVNHLFEWLVPLYEETTLRGGKAHAPAFSASLFQPDTWATYRGSRGTDGAIVLGRIGLWPNRPYALWEKWPTKFDPRKATPMIHPPDYASHTAGSAVFSPIGFGNRNRVLSILPDRNVQEYVSRLGASLVPQYQKAIPETSDTKVDFRFYVVQSGGDFEDEVSNFDSLPWTLVQPSWDDAVLALPSGAIFVPTRTLTGVESGAQLAAILSGAIASVLQEQGPVAWFESDHQGGGDPSAAG
jgi:hypothetical protein